MLALCLMLSVTYYAQNDDGIIGWSLVATACYHVLQLFYDLASYIYAGIWQSVKYLNLV